jgi:hypothetical protein
MDTQTRAVLRNALLDNKQLQRGQPTNLRAFGNTPSVKQLRGERGLPLSAKLSDTLLRPEVAGDLVRRVGLHAIAPADGFRAAVQVCLGLLRIVHSTWA